MVTSRMVRVEDANVLDLFAGCGGLSKGFEQAGFRIAAANEFWEPAGLTYQKNHPETRFYGGDVTKDETKKAIFDFFKNKKCHIIVGGPPCQAYSTAGLRDPNDPRGRLFEDYVQIVRTLQPDIFVMENVKGILTMEHDREEMTAAQKRKFAEFKRLEKERAELLLLRKQSKNNPKKFIFGSAQERRLDKLKKQINAQLHTVTHARERVTEQIVRRFKQLGYRVQFKLLTAADYGVPQKRQRVIFIGTKHNVPIIFPKPTHSKRGTGTARKKKSTLKEESILDWMSRQSANAVELNINDEEKLLPWVSVQEAIDDLKDKPEDKDWSHTYTNHDTEFIEKIKKTEIGESVFGGYSDAFFRNPANEPSRTVKENHGGVMVHYEKHRVMTPRELARLQSFPDTFSFVGGKSTVLKQIGNAVPVGLGAAIGGAVKQMLGELEKRRH